jgi:hypothetical protein
LLVVAIVLAGFGVVFAHQAAHGTVAQTANSADAATASPAAAATATRIVGDAQRTKTIAPTNAHPTATPIEGVDATETPPAEPPSQ